MAASMSASFDPFNELEAAQKKCADLKTLYDKSLNVCRELREDIADREDRCATLENQLEEQTDYQLLAKNADLEEYAEYMDNKYDDLKIANNSLKTEYDELREAHDWLLKQSESDAQVRQQRDNLQCENNKLQNELQSTKATYDQLKNAYNELRENRNDVYSQLEKAKEQSGNFVKVDDQFSTKYNDLKNQHDIIANQLQQAMAAESSGQATIAAAKEYCSGLENQILELQGKLKEKTTSQAAPTQHADDEFIEKVKSYCSELEETLRIIRIECEAVKVERMEQDSLIHYYRLNEQKHVEEQKQAATTKSSPLHSPKFQSAARRQFVKAQASAIKKRRRSQTKLTGTFQSILGKKTIKNHTTQQLVLNKKSKATKETRKKRAIAFKESTSKVTNKLQQALENVLEEETNKLQQAFDNVLEEEARLQRDTYRQLIQQPCHPSEAIAVTTTTIDSNGHSYANASKAAHAGHGPMQAEAILNSMCTVFETEKGKRQAEKIARLVRDNPVLDKALRVAMRA